MANLTPVPATPFARASSVFERIGELANLIDGFAERAIGPIAPRPDSDETPTNGGSLGKLEEGAAEAHAALARAEDTMRGLYTRFGFHVAAEPASSLQVQGINSRL